MLSPEGLHGLYAGRTGVVIGNGPSLKDVPLDFLRSYSTFGSNRIYLMFHPTFYVCVNPLVWEQNKQDISTLGGSMVKFLPKAWGDKSSYPLATISTPMFSFNPMSWVYEGYTVTFVSLQLAFYLGFETILLVGIDHRYTFEGAPNERHMLQGEDPNHFSPDYFRGQFWNNPDLERSEKAYQMARIAYEDNGRRIINLTPNSALEVFEKGELVEWLQELPQ